MNNVPVYNTNALPWPNPTNSQYNTDIAAPIPVNYGYDIEAVGEFARYKGERSTFVNITFPNGKTLISWDFADEGAYAYIKLFNERKDLWQANQRASAKKMSLEEIMFDATDNSIEAVYDALHDYYVQGKSICVEWEGKTIYSIDCSYSKKAERLSEIKNTSPEQYAKTHPNFNTSGATFVSSMGLTIDEAVDKMIKANKAGENIYTRIQTRTILSNKVYSSWATSVDAVYRQGFGKTKLEYDKALQQKQENLFIDYDGPDKEKKMNFLLKQIDNMLIAEKELSEQLYDNGLPYVEPLFDEGEWREWVEEFISSGESEALECSINIMKCLSEDDFQQAHELFEESNRKSLPHALTVRATLEHFCPENFNILISGDYLTINEEIERS